MVSNHDVVRLLNEAPSPLAMSKGDLDALSKEEGRGFYLIDEVLAMIITKLLSPYYPMQVCFHELLNQQDLRKAVKTFWRLEYVEDANDVLVSKMTQELDFAQCSEAEHGMFKGSYALDGHLALSREVESGDDDTVSAWSKSNSQYLVCCQCSVSRRTFTDNVERAVI